MARTNRVKLSARGRTARAIAIATEVAIVVSGVAYVVVGELWTLLLWEGIALAYLLGGLIVVWDGRRHDEGSDEIRGIARWAWILPLVASITGAYSAVVALVAQADGDGRGLPLAVTASLGVVLSWALLQVGFAWSYWAADQAGASGAVRFPGRRSPALIDYLYFSFTIGSSFATSDAEVRTLAVRRIVMLHSILSFFYNALVVAVAFQVLQEAVQR